MPRYRRYFNVGKCYFLTVVTSDRIQVFDTEWTLQLLLNSFVHCSEKYPFTNYAFVIMPDHFHVIVEFLKNHTPADLVRCLKRRFLIDYKMVRQNFSGTIWQKRYYDHIIRDEDDFARHIDYIHFNPVKHGLVTNPHNWHFSTISKYQYPPDWGAVEPDALTGMDYE